MKVAVISNIKSLRICEKSNYIVERLKCSKDVFVEKLDIISDVKKLENKYDIYILITNSINEVLFCKRKIKNHKKILIITKNANVRFIACSIDLTKNLLYFNVDFDIIKQKIYSIYAENN